MEKERIDFKGLRRSIRMRAVLDRYEIWGLGTSGEKLIGKCPIHKGPEETFLVNLGTDRFRCTSCRRHGNIFDFVAAMEGCTVRKAAIHLASWFDLLDRIS